MLTGGRLLMVRGMGIVCGNDCYVFNEVYTFYSRTWKIGMKLHMENPS